MVRVDRRHAGRARSAAWATAALLCLPALAACGSTTAQVSGVRPAASSARTPAPYGKPLLRCTSAQQSAASGSVRVLSVISSQTVHVTVGERVDIAQTGAPMRPGGTGVGKLYLGAGQQVICQSGNVEGRFTGPGGKPGQRLPLIITHAGRAEIRIVAEYVEGNSPEFEIVYIDATASQATS
jgi:hypothetical protein